MKTNCFTYPILVILTLLLSSLVAEAQEKKYQIISIYPQNTTVTIGSIPCKKDDIFSETARIQWSRGDQFIRTFCTSDNRSHSFSARAFADRNVNTVAAYFIHNKLSSKSAGKSRWTVSNGVIDRTRFPEKRIALVVGNANYTNPEISPLRNPISDASSVTRKLNELGFDVWCGYDCKIDEFRQIVSDYLAEVQRGSYQVSLIYYTGHGLQYEFDHERLDFLLPVDIALTGPTSLQYAQSVKDLLYFAGNTACETNIFILDCCRDTKPSWNRSTSAQSGLIQVPDNFAMLQSTGAGDTAKDWIEKNDTNSPFASAFLESVGKPGEDLTATFENIRNSVLERTKRSQHPFYQNQLFSTFYFCREVPKIIQKTSNPSSVTVPQESPKSNTSSKQTPSTATGSLKITSTPSGAVIYLNGKKTNAKTDASFSGITPGKYEIRLESNGFQPYEGEFTIEPDKRTVINITMKPPFNKGGLEIKVHPSYAKVTINDKPITNSYQPINPGRYQIKAHAYGYETKTESVLINAGQITTVSLDLRQTFASRLLSTFDESAFKYFQIGAGYAFAPNCPFGGNITAGWGPLELGFTIAGNISQKGFLTQDDGKFWRPKNYWSITPGVKLKYLGLGLGLGAINAKNLDDYSFPFTDNVGNSFTIDEKANPIFRNSIDSQNYFIMTPTAFGFIPLGDSPSDFYFGAGYAICPAIKSRGGFFFTIGLRFNSYNY